ncbi:MAG: hypothetical protein ACRD82_21030, partial [Blastocatellia bacterium]
MPREARSPGGLAKFQKRVINFMKYSEIVEAEGHLVDSQILSKVMDRVIECGAVYEVMDFNLGRTNEQFSHLQLRVIAPSEDILNKTLEELIELGCYQKQVHDVTLKPAPMDRVVPDDFYSTTNHMTFARLEGTWLEVGKQRMDAVIVISGDNGTEPGAVATWPGAGTEPGAVATWPGTGTKPEAVATGSPRKADCRKLRDVKQGEMIVCGAHGIRIQPEFKERDRLGFAFMANEISSERRTETAVKKIAAMMRQIKAEAGRIVFVAGPVVVHTGGTAAFCEIIRRGFADALLAGNAIAVHDIEHQLFGTSLGVDLEHGNPIEEGHKNHMRAINTVNRYGSIRGAVEAGVLRQGVMYECVKNNVPFVLAGSIR